MNTDPKNPSSEPTPIADSEAPPQHPADDHKVAQSPPVEDSRVDDDPAYRPEESGE